MHVIRPALALLCFPATLLLAQTAPAPAAPAVTVVHCPRLFDSTAGKMLGPSTVVIRGDKFEKVESGTQSAAHTHPSASF